MEFNANDVGLLLIVISFVVLLVRAGIDAYVNRDVLHGYRALVDGLTSNTQLKDTLEQKYMALNPDQKRIADQALDLVELLSRVTPTDADDKLSQWTKEVRDGLANG